MGDLESTTITKQEVTIEIQKKIDVCVCDSDQSVSSSFVFNIGKVHHFKTVKKLNMTVAEYPRPLDMCSY